MTAWPGTCWGGIPSAAGGQCATGWRAADPVSLGTLPRLALAAERARLAALGLEQSNGDDRSAALRGSWTQQKPWWTNQAIDVSQSRAAPNALAVRQKLGDPSERHPLNDVL